MPPQIATMPMIAGEPWLVTVTVEDDTALRSRWSVVNIDPLGGALLIRDATATDFEPDSTIVLSSNADPAVNKAYTITSSAQEDANVILTVAASVVSLPVAAVDIGTSRLRVTTSSLASVSRFASGAIVALSGNANDASNVAYRVWDAYIPSSPANSLWVRVEPSLPPATTASGNLIVPTISPTAGQTAIATLIGPAPIQMGGWSFAAEFRDGPTESDTLITTVSIDSASADSGLLTLSLTPVQTALFSTRAVAYLDLVAVSPFTLAQRSVRATWRLGDSDARVLRPTRVDNTTLRFGQGGALPVRLIPVVTEAP